MARSERRVQQRRRAVRRERRGDADAGEQQRRERRDPRVGQLAAAGAGRTGGCGFCVCYAARRHGCGNGRGAEFAEC